MRLFWILATCSLVTACTTPGAGGSPLIPDKALQITSGKAIPLVELLVPLAIYLVYDPLAPNWEIEESRLGEDTYRLALTMKRFHTGGAGESIQLVKRRGEQLARQSGYANYVLLDYSEGIDSQTIGARRVATSTIRLLQPRQADSFVLNNES